MRGSIAGLALLCACAGTAQQPAAGPWSEQAVTVDTTDGIRILVLHDMEGLSGQSDPATFWFGSPRYPEGQQLLAADVNAVVAGLFDGGATEVHVVDGHGSGNPEPDVRRDLLDPRAQQIQRDAPFDAYFDLVAPGAYDAVAVVGMHSKTGSRGFAAHTYTLGIEFRIHGQSITETELVGLSWGRENIPVIFASGDDRLAADLATMPWIRYVTVKQALAADSAAPRPVAEARAELRQGAAEAVQRLRKGEARAMRVRLPVQATLHTVPPASLAHMDSVPGVDYRDNAVTFETPTLHAAYRGLAKLVGLATQGYRRVYDEEIASRADAAAITGAYRERLRQRWFDVESGRWSAPAANAAGGPTVTHHGYR